MAQPIHDAFLQMPPITRAYATACVLTTLACHLELVSPFQLYFNLGLILRNYEVWRLLTNFLYFGNLGIDFFFHMFFLIRYCRMLEEGSFRGRTEDFFMLFLFGMTSMLIVAPFMDLNFLGQALTFMLVYVWGRRNPNVRMSFLGLFQFNAPYLAYVLLGLSFVLGHSLEADILGVVVGHIYYFLEDVYAMPLDRGGLGGPHVLTAPSFIKRLFVTPEGPAAPPEERPGGWAWGEAAAAAPGQ